MRPRVKICGVRRLEDALLAAELGADAVGFVFWPQSPRFVDPYRARAIASQLPPFLTTVGVFVDQPADAADLHTRAHCSLNSRSALPGSGCAISRSPMRNA